MHDELQDFIIELCTPPNQGRTEHETKAPRDIALAHQPDAVKRTPVPWNLGFQY